MSDNERHNPTQLLEELERLRRRNAKLEALLGDKRPSEGEQQFAKYSIDHTGETIYGISADGKVFYANDAGCLQLGYTRDELIGMSMTEIDVEVDCKSHLETAVKVGGETFRSRHRRKDGSEFPVQVTLNYCADDGGYFFSFVTDISKQIDIEQTLASERSFSEALFGSLPGIAFAHDGEDHFLRWNENLKRVLGYTDEELHTMDSSDAFVERDRGRFRKVIKQTKETGKGQMEATCLTKDGREIPTSFVAMMTQDDQSPCIAVVGVDISELKQVEQALREQRDFAETLIETAPVIVLVLDAKGRIVRFNSYMEELCGYHLQEVQGKDWFSMFLPVRNRDRTRELFSDAIASPRAGGNVDQVATKDGRELDIEWHDSALKDSEGNPIGLLALGLDVTQRRRWEEALQRSESLYRSLFEGSVDGIVFCTLDSQLVDWNASYQQMLGYTEDELRTMTLADITPERWREWEQEEIIEGQLKTHGWAPVYEKEYIRKDGTVFPVEVTAYLLEPQGDRPEMMWGVVRDISDRQMAENERRRLEAELNNAQKLEAVGELASGIAHDVNNLLTVIFANIQYIKEQTSQNESIQSCANMIEEAGQQAADVTRSLLMFSRAVPGQKKRIDLGEVITNSCRILNRFLPDAIELVVAPLPEPPVMAYADNTQIQQVLVNLAINARDAMPSGGTLRLELTRVVGSMLGKEDDPEVDWNAAYALLKISDTGVGMSAEVRDRLFQPFFSTKVRAQGIGLGLAVVHGIIRDHEGWIDVQSEEGKGATFTVILPCYSDEMMPDILADKAKVVSVEGGTILLAEDNPYVQTAVISMLKTMGHEIVAVGDGAELMEAWRADHVPFSLFVLDVDLPKRSGIDCLEEIRSEGVTTPALIITGGVDEGLEERLDERAFLLRKPFQMQELGAQIQRILTEYGD